MKVLDEFKKISDTLENPFVVKWKETGKKCIGYTCTYLPEEILYAADVLPYRLTGKGVSDTSTADSHLARVNCSFCRCLLELGLNGRYDFLDGAVFITGCDHNRRVFDNWKASPKALPLMHMFPVPHLISQDGLEWFKEEVLIFKKTLETHLGIGDISDHLEEAIIVTNQTRKLLRKLYDLRAMDSPPVSGAEMLDIITAGSVIPKPEFNRLLSRLFQEMDTDSRQNDARVRLLIAGSLMDESDFIKNIEELGAVVVSDFLCFGTRSMWELVDENDDPIDALSRRYYAHASCPRMVGEYPSRLNFIKDQIKRARVQGVILESIKFCDLHGTDNALLKTDLEKAGTPVIEMERLYGPLADAGRIRTRAQAFIERIRR